MVVIGDRVSMGRTKPLSSVAFTKMIAQAAHLGITIVPNGGDNVLMQGKTAC